MKNHCPDRTDFLMFLKLSVPDISCGRVKSISHESFFLLEIASKMLLEEPPNATAEPRA